MSIIDRDTPRYQLPIERLPRGLVKFPQRIMDGLEMEQERLGIRFADEYARQTLEDGTLIYYYQGFPVAYRSVPEGLEVLAVGWREIGPYWTTRENGIKVVQP